MVQVSGVYRMKLVRGDSATGAGEDCASFCNYYSTAGQFFPSGNPYFLKCTDSASNSNFLKVATDNSHLLIEQQTVGDPSGCLRTLSEFHMNIRTCTMIYILYIVDRSSIMYGYCTNMALLIIIDFKNFVYKTQRLATNILYLLYNLVILIKTETVEMKRLGQS